MARYSEEILNEVRQSNDIVDVISQYVHLKRSGRNFFGLCPFHNEKSPSFSVSPDKQIFHCFGCGVGGNVITFVSKIEGLNFVETVQMLAERAKHHKKEIEPEMANIAKLRQIMEDYVDGKRPTIKNVMIEEFAKELDNILNMYKPKKLSLLGPKQDGE